MKVSLFEITYKKKLTFSRYSNLLRCTCIYIYIYIYIYMCVCVCVCTYAWYVFLIYWMSSMCSWSIDHTECCLESLRLLTEGLDWETWGLLFDVILWWTDLPEICIAQMDMQLFFMHNYHIYLRYFSWNSSEEIKWIQCCHAVRV